MELLENYQSALDAIYEHIGFKEDWYVFPLDISFEYYWKIEDSQVTFYDSLEAYKEDDGMHTYSNEVISHRFYPKSVYIGNEITGILVDTHTDGNRFLQLFDNKKEIKD